MSRRIERIAEQIQQEVGLLLLDGVKDPRIRSVTLTGVQVTPDLGLARVYYTLLVDEPAARRAAALGLQSTTPFLRRVLGQRLHLRRVPQLEFHFDETGNKAARIDRLLETIRTELAESESSTPTAALPSGDDDARWDDSDADPGDDDE
ncbi:MAG: 30S ribosome-binding factor RbfA, partial [Myxococcota bacterium]|nr:30S ribosome-binding factor RbfA [Myxococcota bacterium]